MTTAQKVSLSLLISVLVFGAFAVAAFSGLFDYIESSFYDQKVRSDIQGRLLLVAAAVDGFDEKNRLRFGRLAEEDLVRRAYEVGRSQDDIFNLSNLIGTLLEENPGLLFFRLVDPTFTKLHFSTLDTDGGLAPTMREYRDNPYEPPLLDTLRRVAQDADTRGAVVVLPEQNQVAYIFPVRYAFQAVQAVRGYAVFHLSRRGLAAYLLQNRLLDIGEPIEFAKDNTIVARTSNLEPEAVREAVGMGDRETAFVTDLGVRFFVFATTSENNFRVAAIVPEAEFQMQPAFKGVLGASLFVTVFLTVFLLLNLRQDPVLVLKERVKKFQIHILQETLEGRTDEDWARLQTALEARRDEVKNEIKRGAGKLRPEDQTSVDEYLDKSWQEIIDVIGTKAEPRLRGDVDIRKLEAVIEKVVANLQVLQQDKAVQVTRPGRRLGADEAAGHETGVGAETGERASAEELEEIGAVEELGEEEVSAELEEFEELEQIEEAAEISSGEESGTDAPVGPETGERVSAEELEEIGAVEEVAAEEVFGELEDFEELEPIEEAAEITSGEESGTEIEQDAYLLETVGPTPTLFNRRGMFSATLMGRSTAQIQELVPAEGERLRFREGQVVPFAELEENGYIVRFDIEALSESVASAIVEGDDGLYRIRDEVLAPDASGQGGGLAKLADEVTTGRGPGTEAGVEALFGDSGIDLTEILDEGRAESNRSGRHPTEDGSLFRVRNQSLVLGADPKDEAGVTKALVAVTRRFRAAAAGVWLSSGDELRIRHRVGMGADPVDQMFVKADSVLGSRLRNDRRVLFLNWPFGKIEEFRGLVTKGGYMADKRLVFIPALIGNDSGYLGIGLQQEPSDLEARIRDLAG